MKILLILCASYLLARGTLALVNLTSADIAYGWTFAVMPVFIGLAVWAIVDDNRRTDRIIASFNHSR